MNSDILGSANFFESLENISRWLLSAAKAFFIAHDENNSDGQRFALQPIPYRHDLSFDEILLTLIDEREALASHGVSDGPVRRMFERGVALAIMSWTVSDGRASLHACLRLGAKLYSTDALKSAALLVASDRLTALDEKDLKETGVLLAGMAMQMPHELSATRIINAIHEMRLLQSTHAFACCRLYEIKRSNTRWMQIVGADIDKITEMDDLSRSVHMRDIIRIVGLTQICRDIVAHLLTPRTEKDSASLNVIAQIVKGRAAPLINIDGEAFYHAQEPAAFVRCGLVGLSAETHDRIMTDLEDLGFGLQDGNIRNDISSSIIGELVEREEMAVALRKFGDVLNAA